MDARTAITLAKNYVAEVFEPEGAFNIGLEELRFDDREAKWEVTVGFSRPWDRPIGVNVSLSGSGPRRSFKLIEISDATGRVLGMMDRQIAA